MVNGFPAGGAGDTIARMLAAHLGQSLGQPVVVENRPGASGTIAAGQVAKADPDGYTIYLGSASEFSHARSAMGSRLAYNPESDFHPIRILVRLPLMLVAHPSLSVSTVKQLLDLAQSKPGALNYASFGNGSTPHIAGEVFNLKTGSKLVHVPYKGSAPAMTDVLAGRVPLIFDTVAYSYPHVKAGALKALAVASDRRVPLAREIPTMVEAGVPDFRIESWLGLFCQAKTPPFVVEALSAASSQFINSVETRSKLEGMGFIVDGAGPDVARAFIQQETVRMSKLIADSGVRFE
nr:tripartite tricarboxylate transporter substrate binding protein [Variovorax paradoxus]